MLKQVAIAELKPGMMVTRVIEQSGPVKIRRVGLIKSNAMVKGLTEMGVRLLEVDEAQSFTLEFDDDVEDSAQSIATDDVQGNAKGNIQGNVQGNARQNDDDNSAVLTPTQRLMARDKQSAVVDRQLSQQFHRSLFMPAIDEMPSKWRLFVRPYAMLFACITMGFALGFLAITIVTHASSWFTDAPQVAGNELQSQTLAERGNEVPVDALTLSAQPALSAPLQNSSGARVQSGSAPVGSQSTIAIQTNQQNMTVQSLPQLEREAQLAQAAQSADQQQEQRSESEPEPIRTLQTINGIVLDEGQRVLGYGGFADDANSDNNADDANSADDASISTPVQQNNAGNRPLSSALFNRVSRAAAQLEAEQGLSSNELDEPFDLSGILQDEPIGPVLDLRSPASNQDPANNQIVNTTVVRIDQLPAAMLTQIPAMSFSAHMFASNPQDRWVRVNGKRLSEGDFIEAGIAIVEIESERLILSFKGQRFSMNALSDW